MGFGVWGLGFGVWGLGFGVWAFPAKAVDTCGAGDAFCGGLLFAVLEDLPAAAVRFAAATASLKVRGLGNRDALPDRAAVEALLRNHEKKPRPPPDEGDGRGRYRARRKAGDPRTLKFHSRPSSPPMIVRRSWRGGGCPYRTTRRWTARRRHLAGCYCRRTVCRMTSWTTSFRN